MTLDKVLSKIDSQKPNAFSRQDKIAWINQLEGMVKAKVIDTHEDGEKIFFDEYTDKDGKEELLVPAPFDRMYLHWLEAQIDYGNAEYGKYNNSMMMFNTMWGEYARWYNSQHLPRAESFVYF